MFVQHLDPSSSSLLRELLRTATETRVIEIAGRRKLKPGCVYIAPARQFLEIKNGAVRPVVPDTDESPLTAVDHFFHSLAEDQAGRAVGIVLSGSGSDGTVGLKAISDAGGLTFAQDSASAKFDSMPRSAATTGVADHVCRPREIAAERLRYAAHVEEFVGVIDKDGILLEIDDRSLEIARSRREEVIGRFEPYRLIEDVRSIMAVRATESGLTLEVEYDGKIPKVIQSDANQPRRKGFTLAKTVEWTSAIFRRWLHVDARRT
ncbi:Chemotaxis response regulator protein-glutamate methylesterase [Novipirellula artificiosorum]|uniref:protein-glutamate methylesterase n=1 Tax=Novipirellula artificiosorum TaxID=2528016 RepID=A0A5C6D6M5_9BACT|nr:Chemotaxis response regulator protein-glutamate methylesterase [Novipirellula artificiosorum]